MALSIYRVSLTCNMRFTFCILAATSNNVQRRPSCQFRGQVLASQQPVAVVAEFGLFVLCNLCYLFYALTYGRWVTTHRWMAGVCVGVRSVWRLRCALIFLTIRCRLTCAIHQPPAGHSQRRAVSMCLRVHMCMGVCVCVCD